VLNTLARNGAIDREELAAALAAEPTAVSQVEHAKALASLPDAEAKAWAWERFVGEVEVPNYELEAIGLGMWQVGHEHLTDAYVARYFEDVVGTGATRQGWLLGLITGVFYPRWSTTEETIERARTLLARDDVDSAIRREIVDETWDLERRVAIRVRYGARP
jgi:aminopeptidase N